MNSNFIIENPKIGDEVAVGKVHLQSWKESFINDESSLDEAIVDKLRGNTITEDGNSRRRDIFKDILNDSKNVLYKIVRNKDTNEIVGFMHGSKNDKYNELEALFLLNEAKNQGIGSKLINLFIEWSDKDKPAMLEVFTFNKNAINFYKKFGFEITNRPEELYKDTIKHIEMIRPIDSK